MSSIERITSVTRIVTRGDQKIEVVVWNKTVANLSLMALGQYRTDTSDLPTVLTIVVQAHLHQRSSLPLWK